MVYKKKWIEVDCLYIFILKIGKPRDEHDPKLAELDKHIEEIVEKEQHLPRTKSTASNDSTSGIIK